MNKSNVEVANGKINSKQTEKNSKRIRSKEASNGSPEKKFEDRKNEGGVKRLLTNSEFLKKSSNNIILSFSRGKDSIVSWLLLKELGFNVYPIYYSLCPYMDFELESLKYYEDFFKTKIIKIPSSTFNELYSTGYLQTKEAISISKKNTISTYSNEDIRLMAIEEYGLDKNTYIAVGATVNDSMQRRIGINKVNGLNHKSKKFYPIADFTVSDIEEYLIKYKVKLPIDYKIWGSTFDGLNLRWLGELKEHLPKDFDLVKMYFPFIEAELFRKNYCNCGIKNQLKRK